LLGYRHITRGTDIEDALADDIGMQPREADFAEWDDYEEAIRAYMDELKETRRYREWYERAIDPTIRISGQVGNWYTGSVHLARLSALMGAGRVREMIFTARLIEAEEALTCGLISEVLPDEEALMVRAADLADTLAQMAPLTLRATKEAMRRVSAATRIDDSDLIEMCYMSRDFRHGLEAFLAKEKPEWSGA